VRRLAGGCDHVSTPELSMVVRDAGLVARVRIEQDAPVTFDFEGKTSICETRMLSVEGAKPVEVVRWQDIEAEILRGLPR
jgi:metal-sulfur cluster biosynthetic enzyme